MLLQTNSYFVPKEKRTEHARLVKRFRALMLKLGAEEFDVCEQTGPNWSSDVGGRFVQLMKFRDEAHQRKVHDAEQSDAGAQDLVREFCELIDFGYQQQQGMATTAYYKSLTPISPTPAAVGDVSRQSAGLIASNDVIEDMPPLDLDQRRDGVKHAAGRNGEIDD